jgi:hypothetical protein
VHSLGDALDPDEGATDAGPPRDTFVRPLQEKTANTPLTCGFAGGAGWTRTSDRRIMSPRKRNPFYQENEPKNAS